MRRKISTAASVMAVIALFSGCGEVAPSNEGGQTTTAAAVSSEEVSSAAEESSQIEESSVIEVSSEAEESSLAQESSQAEESSAVQAETDSDELLKPGFYRFVDVVDTGDEYYRSDTYYQFADDGTGYFVIQATGEMFTFDYTLEGDKLHIVCDNGFIDQQLSLTKNEDGSLDGVVNNIGVTKIYYQEGRELSQYRFYSNDELCQMAKEYYNSSDGRECSYARAVIDKDGNIILSLYEAYDGGEDLIDTYDIDRETAQGTDKAGNFVDLTTVSEN